jgi:large subunit ribosomal protein L30
MASPRQTANAAAAAAPGGRTLRIQLVRSPIGNPARQRATVRALGLRRIHQVVTQADSPATRGMVARVPHLVRILED